MKKNKWKCWAVLNDPKSFPDVTERREGARELLNYYRNILGNERAEIIRVRMIREAPKRRRRRGK